VPPRPATRRPQIREAPELSEIRDADLDRGVTVARAAELLGCDASTVRRLVKAGALTGWRVSADPARRGEPRLSLASIEAWRRQHRLESDASPADAANKRPLAPNSPTASGAASTALHRAAIANLKALGIV